ncbi:hypothetical protein QLQ12_40185 [Actinoplanes sp. NEAU-A12]|uniref:Uncharacterized protein n=1 Tax=Actinoplanes sandaracinus TaxID=3045177 RepID=A0ABT6WYY9_9ACTN|nr:hypothetical protein [Actinoplanes sandaracinus]MDI6104826.1 hypothetical protein [Actinoplanes sandaracinus]
MQEEELFRIGDALRRMCGEQNLTWVIEAVDAAAREGFTESVNPDSSAYPRGDDDSWPYPFSWQPAPRGRPQVEIRERAYTTQEEVLLLLDAMLAIYRDLPDLCAETIAVLRRGWEGRVPIPDSVVFIDPTPATTEFDSPFTFRRAELDRSTEFALEVETEEEQRRRQRVVDSLLALRGEVLR